MSERMLGTVALYQHLRRWGFVYSDNNGRYFVHAVDVVGPVLLAGDRVEFTPVVTPRGPRATKVRRVVADVEAGVYSGVPREGGEPPTTVDDGGR